MFQYLKHPFSNFGDASKVTEIMDNLPALYTDSPAERALQASLP